MIMPWIVLVIEGKERKGEEINRSIDRRYLFVDVVLEIWKDVGIVRIHGHQLLDRIRCLLLDLTFSTHCNLNELRFDEEKGRN